MLKESLGALKKQEKSLISKIKENEIAWANARYKCDKASLKNRDAGLRESLSEVRSKIKRVSNDG